jgi:small subunit ribosomal protein S20
MKSLDLPGTFVYQEVLRFPIIFRKEQHKVANHKSALKRAGQNERRRLRNKAVQTRVKTVVKEVRLAVAENGDDAAQQFNTAQSTIDKAAKKGVLHKKTASRKISRLAKQVNAQ